MFPKLLKRSDSFVRLLLANTVSSLYLSLQQIAHSKPDTSRVIPLQRHFIPQTLLREKWKVRQEKGQANYNQCFLLCCYWQVSPKAFILLFQGQSVTLSESTRVRHLKGGVSGWRALLFQRSDLRLFWKTKLLSHKNNSNNKLLCLLVIWMHIWVSFLGFFCL